MFRTVLLVVVAASYAAAQTTAGEHTRVVSNRAPLAPNAFNFLPLTSVKPKGWLLRQLVIQAAGQTGHLDEFWPSLNAKTSAWRGGGGEGWERGPYYMDGLIPLAYLTGDQKLIAKAKDWVEWTLKSQRPDGSIGPVKNDDWWPNMIMLKVLQQHYEATGDARVIPLMEKYLLHHLAEGAKRPLRAWAIYRWADELVSVIWTYNRTGNPKLLDLARLLAEQGYDWRHHFAHFVYPFKVTRTESGLHSHVVNNAMAIKTSALWSRVSKDPADRNATARLFEVMDRYHLMPQGVHSGDEHYAGTDPSQGTELCAVVEAMYSIEHVLSVAGRPEDADRLERMTFNALPATLSADMWTHQYDQQPNQVLCSRHPRKWTTNGPDSNLFGLEPNFGCCTANFHQGWPKFVANLWMATPDGGLAAVGWGPSEVTTTVGNTRVTVTSDTEYPFRESIRLSISPASAVVFPLALRIPSWASGARIEVNGRPVTGVRAGSFHRIQRRWQAGDTVSLHFPMPLRKSKWRDQGAIIERGPLVFSLKVAEEWRKLKDYGPVADWELHPQSSWNYGLLFDPKQARVEERPLGDFVWSAQGAPLVIHTKGRKIPGWQVVDGSAGPVPSSPAESSEPVEEVQLIPYGAAKLRVTVLPEMHR